MDLRLFLLILATIPLSISLDVLESVGERVECSRSKIDKNVTLALGQKAGNFFKANISHVSMKQCVARCCKMRACDVALLKNAVCYSVQCHTLESCVPKQNDDKRFNIQISYIARPSHEKVAVKDSTGETAIDDELVSEANRVSPSFTYDSTSPRHDGISDESAGSEDSARLYSPHRTWKEWQDLIVAIGCGFVATAVGVIGVILMTRRLVDEEDDDMDFLMSRDRLQLDELESPDADITKGALEWTGEADSSAAVKLDRTNSK